ncbi:MAG: Ig-like domain-containing protein [bacterium]|nr:Ig-like domain-containing protein [bacterium]
MSLFAASRRPFRPAPSGALVYLGLAGLIVTLSACGDSPYCVFGGDCSDGGSSGPGGSGIGSAAAVRPTTAVWIENADPELEQVRPRGTGASSTTPVALRFSESLNPESLRGAFEIVESTFGAPIPFLDPPALVGDGRLVVLDPLTDLVPSTTYIVQYAEGAEVTDLTGQAVAVPSDRFISDFGVTSSDPDAPRVVMSYPDNNEINQSDVTEVSVVFDRPMDITTIDIDSWVVLADGAAPVPNPDPVPFFFLEGPTPIPVPTILRWTSLDTMTLERSSLGSGAEVEVTLSPVGNEIEDTDGNVLEERVVRFDVTPIGMPSMIIKPSLPLDALGLADLSGTDPVFQVDVPVNALDGDILRVFVFGTGRASGELETLSRRIDVTAATGQIDVTADDLDLLGSGNGRFAEGDVDIAVRIERGNARTPVRVADSDPDTNGSQPYFFDVVPPEVLGFSTSGTVTDSFVSDARHVVLVGRASEEIRSVRVETTGGMSNFTGPDDRPDTVLADKGGLFVAAPVLLDVLDSSAAAIDYTVEVYDRALNEAVGGALMGTFDQLGAIGPGAPATGSTMEITVFNGTNLNRLSNALVITHQDDGGVITFVDSAVTDASGFAMVNGATVGETIVTVDVSDFDLFTFHGAPRQILQIPLTPTGLADAATGGTIGSPLAVDLSLTDNQIGDSRLATPGPRLLAVEPCVTNPVDGRRSCPFGPDDILPRRIGVQTVLAADLSVPPTSFDAQDFLLGFALRGPAAPVAAGDEESVAGFEVETLLSSLPSEGEAIGLDPQLFTLATAPNFGMLDGDPAVTIEAISPGVSGSTPVGLGIAFDPLMTGVGWNLFGAYPGAVDGIDDGGGDELGELIQRGTFEQDLFLRVAALDTDGDRTGVRARFSNLSMANIPAIEVPTFLVPGPGGNSGGPSYNIVAENVIPDVLGIEGLVRTTLTDTSGRSWVLWRPDPTGMGDVTTHVPNIGIEGGVPLDPGTVMCTISAFAWESLDTNLFLWTDVEREHEVFAHTVEQAFTVMP